jgi:hypothetical protein
MNRTGVVSRWWDTEGRCARAEAICFEVKSYPRHGAAALAKVEFGEAKGEAPCESKRKGQSPRMNGERSGT